MARAEVRFARLQRLKERLRKAAAEDLAAVDREQAAVERQAAAHEAAREANRVRAGAVATAGTLGADLHLYAAYETAQTARSRARRAEAAALAEVREARRRDVLARRTEERQLEMLAARQRARTELAAATAAAALADDLARRGHRRLSTAPALPATKDDR
jgi:flagellar export protein FliJ